MKATLLMLLATLLFSLMGVAVKLASEFYGTGEIVAYRGLIGALLMMVLARWKGISLRTTVPAMHLWRSLSGVASLTLWFYAISVLPLATAVTLNYMSSVWMAAFLIGGGVLLGKARIEGRLVATVLAGFAGVVLILRPSVTGEQLWGGITGLMSGMLAAVAYLQVTALGRIGEPEQRVVFYFSLCSAVVGAALAQFVYGWHAHSLRGAFLLLAVGLCASVAQLLLTRAYAIGNPLINATLAYMGIVYSFGFGVWLFDDPVHGIALAGMALIVASGIAATRLRAKRVAVASESGSVGA